MFIWICPSLCCRNVPNSTIFRKLGNGFLCTSKVFWTLLWAFRHLGSPFRPFLCIFGPPEAPRKFCRQPLKCSFDAFRGGKKVQNSFFRLLAKNEVSSKASILEHFCCLERLRKGPEHVRTPNRHEYVHLTGTRNSSQKFNSPPVMTVKSKKVQNFKIFKGVPMCVYTYYGEGNVQYWCSRPQRAQKTL